mmetsp:Transcript_21462/g.59610  ORF Transcript_21462/g.59610 Transcript_21462/m.59610 type:complete len:367 (+) Transcript_21462:490-1590(+)
MNQAQKVVLVTTMVFLKALHVLFVHESTHHAGDEGSEGAQYKYNTVMAVILAEFIKLALSAGIFLRAYFRESNGEVDPTAEFSAHKDWEGMTFSHGLSYAFPAMVYMIEDNLRFIVMQHLRTPVTWMIFGHLEIPFVAIMSSVLLGRLFTRTQWISIVLLLSGVMSSQLAVCESRLHMPCSDISNYPVKGILMVSVCALFAAFAGISSEFIYKRDLSTSIWLQNCLLYSYAIILNLLALGAKRLGDGSGMHLMTGFDTGMPWMVVLTMAGVGVTVSAVIKHMSSLAKVFTSAFCIFVTAFFSAMFEDFELSLPFILAATEVVCALYLYMLEQERKAAAAGKPGSPCDAELELLATTPKLNAMHGKP